jgi:hypothetical protein
MSSYFGGPGHGGGGGGHGGHGHGGGHHHHHGGGRGIGFGFVPAYVVESCDPALDPYCNPHAMVFGDDAFCVGGSCMGSDFGTEEGFMTHLGNAAGIMSLGRGALILGGLAGLGYAIAHHKVGAKPGVKL